MKKVKESKEIKLDKSDKHAKMSFFKPKGKASEWFKRPPYQIKRGD